LTLLKVSPKTRILTEKLEIFWKIPNLISLGSFCLFVFITVKINFNHKRLNWRWIL